jgi:ATP-binding cassette subfamily C protein LapB
LLRRFELLQKTSTHSSYNAIISTNKLQAQGVIFSNMMMVSVISFGAMRVIGGDMSLAALACCSLLTGRMVQPFARALTLFHELQNVSLAKKRCSVFEGLSDEVIDFSEDTLDGELKLKSGSLSVRNISLPSCGEDHSDERFSFSAKPGEFIGIHCQENVERTELVKLLYGEKIPEKGSVYADGFSSKQWRELGIHKEISVISAKSEIFEGTIIDNITMFGNSHMVESAREAACLIGLEKDIFKLPEGYDTILNVGSTSVLSPGFLQRVKIARALRSKPKLLIFDGANSNMDMRSDKLLTEGLIKLKGKMTAVYFSSRPSFLKISDQRFKLEEGQLLVDTFVPGQANAMPVKSA